MSVKRLRPKYFLLSTPTLDLSTSTHQQTNMKSFQGFAKTELDLPIVKKHPSAYLKQNSKGKAFVPIRDNLNQCMQALSLEQKRNSTLKELNLLLEKNNRETELTFKKVIKPQDQKERRQIQKQKYDLQQISQKHNEEIARISQLRQQVDSSRTDRVVFSALFKKIEREIKQHQSMYKEVIIQSEKRKLTKSKQKGPEETEKIESNDEYEGRNDAIHSFYSKEGLDATSRFFMTLPDKNQNKSNFKKATDRQGDPTASLISDIGVIQTKINRILRNVESESPEEAQEHYSSIAKQNTQLYSKIEKTQIDIHDIEEQIDRINQERRNSLVTEERHMTKLTSLPSTRKLRSLRSFKNTAQEDHIATPNEIIEELTEIIGTQDNSYVQTVNQVEDILLGGGCEGTRRQQNSSESILDNLLHKMQKFDNCERIFSKRQFQGQYLKELSKQRRQGKIKR